MSDNQPAATAWRAGIVTLFRPALAFFGTAAVFETILVLKWTQVIDKGFVYLINGLLPWSDAITYWVGARQLALGFPVDPWIGKRPLFTGLLASVAALSWHNLQVVQVMLVLINAWAVFLLCRELDRSYGRVTAITSFVLLALYYQRFIGMTSTEHLGLSAGCLALAALARGARMGIPRIVWAGMFGIAFALVARAGAFLALPALLVWGVWPYWPHPRLLATRGEGRRIGAGRRAAWRELLICAGVGLAAMALAFVIDGALRQALTPGTQAFNNFSSTLYGVAVGDKGWLRVLHDHPELTSMPDYQAAPLIYRYAFQAIQTHPDTALRGVLDTWWQFFASRDKNAFSFINTNPLLGWFPGAALLVVSAAGIALCIKARSRQTYLLILAFVAGIVLSVPALPPMDAEMMRAYAATIPAQTVIVGLGFEALVGLARGRRLPEPAAEKSGGEMDGRLVLWSGAALLALSFLAPLLFGALIPKTHPDVAAGYANRCPQGQDVLAIYDAPGAALRLTDPKVARTSFVPDLRLSDFRGQMNDNLRIWPEAIRIMKKFKAGQTFLTSLDAQGHSVWVTLDTGSLPSSGRMMVVCAERNPVMPDQQVFYTVERVVDVIK